MIQIEVSGKGIRADSINSLIENVIKIKYPQATVIVTRKEPADSRSDRFTDAQGLVDDAHTEFESLRDELQEWRDNMPENLQDGEKANQLDDVISELDDVISSCEEVTDAGVEFPGVC